MQVFYTSSSNLEEILLLKHIGEAFISTAETPVFDQEEGLHLNSILMLGHCVEERLALEVILNYGTSKLNKISISWLQSTLVVFPYGEMEA